MKILIKLCMLSVITLAPISAMEVDDLPLSEANIHIRKGVIPKELVGTTQDYVKKLPKIIAYKGAVEEKIVRLLQDMKPNKYNNKSILGQETLSGRLSEIMKTCNPVEMYIIGFPFKSLNDNDKVLGNDVDLGEFVGLLTLNHICGEIGKVYKPGAKINIVSDSEVYKDIMPISNAVRTKYKEDLKQLINSCFKDISLNTEMEELALKQLSDINGYTVDDETKNDMRGFFKSEYPNYNEEEIDEITHKIAEASGKFSQAVKKILPKEFVRLSVHPHTNIDEKAGIALIHVTRGTPWHNTPIVCRNLIIPTEIKGMQSINLTSMYQERFGNNAQITQASLKELNEFVNLEYIKEVSKHLFKIIKKKSDTQKIEIAGLQLEYIELILSAENYKNDWAKLGW